MAIPALATLALASLSGAVQAQPIKLQFAIFSPDTEQTYISVFVPFAEAVNKQATGAIAIQLLPDGTLGRSPVQQAQMVLDGVEDIAWIFPSMRLHDYSQG